MYIIKELYRLYINKSNGMHVGFWNLLINSGISLITKDENQDGVQ